MNNYNTLQPLMLEKLENVKPSGSGWTARCPAHDDQHASLSVSTGDDGRTLVHCHTGCGINDICRAVGMTAGDLFVSSPNALTQTKTKGRKRMNYQSPEAAVATLESKHGEPSNRWTYHDTKGNPVGIIVRWDQANGTKDIRPVSLIDDSWSVGGMPPPRPLYQLLELLASASTVYVTEGEKAADAARSIGLVATTSTHGANSADKTDWTPLAGKDVVILPDNDLAGQHYADTVAGILAKLTPPAKVRIVDLPGLPEGGDIVEWIDAHGDAAEPEQMKRELESLASSATAKTPATLGPVLVCMADVEPASVKWLWPGRVPLGRITLLVGRPGEGKSFLTTDMAARVTKGTPWPDGTECPIGSVILIACEDDPADTIRPRLDAHGADASKVYLLSAVRQPTATGETREVMFTLDDLAALDAALEQHADCKLIVVDPIGSFLGDVDAHRDNEVRSVLAPVAKLAEKHGPAVLVVAHSGKSERTRADDLALGSRAFTGIARSVWHLMRDSSDKARRVFLSGKNNLATECWGLAFQFVGHPAVVQWESNPVEMTADDFLALQQAPVKPGPVPQAKAKAAGWLEGLLANGPMEVSKIKAAADAAGHAWRTVQRASNSLGVLSEPNSGSQHTWRLTSDSTCQAMLEGENLAFWHDTTNTGEMPGFDVPEPIRAKMPDCATNQAASNATAV